MDNGDLRIILNTAEFEPRLLPQLLQIYKLGKLQGIIHQIKAEQKLLKEKLG